jgi:uncharacterized protein YggE
VRRLALAAFLLLAAAALAGVLRPEGAAAVEPRDGTITVTGTGSVLAAPDRAQLSFGVESQAATARAAIAANAAEMRRVLEALRKAGARDLATQTVSVSPRYRDGAAEIAGYGALNTVSATIAVDRAGALVDAAVAAGANQVYGPSLSTSDARRFYRDALAAAVEDARTRAAALAAAAGAAVGRVVSIVEGTGVGGPAFEAAKAATDSSTPVEPGSQEISAAVTVTYALS